jgi:hypothetical protein
MILTPLCIITIFVAFGYSIINNSKHKLLCDEFYRKFGYLPGEIIISQAGGVFFTFQKDIYFLRPLIFNKKTFLLEK